MIHDSQIWRAHIPLHARDIYVGNTTGYNTNTAALYGLQTFGNYAELFLTSSDEKYAIIEAEHHFYYYHHRY